MNKSSYSCPSKTSHFLVSGGGKGITAENVIALARAFQCTFTLLGRSALLSAEPTWASEIDNEADLKKSALAYFQEQKKTLSPKELGREVQAVFSSREILKTLQQIRAAGGSGQYLQADITDREDLRTQLSPILQEINGLIHGAGALADKLIEDKKDADFELVYGVKVGGLSNLFTVLPPGQLDYIILFSSVAGYYGNIGQTDYSLSNEILNKTAHYLKQHHPDTQILSIGWGPWDGGMVSPQLRRILTKKNIPMISVEQGTNTLLALMDQLQDNPQWVVGSPLPFPAQPLGEELKSYRIFRRLSLEENPFLGDHVIGGKAVLPTVCAVAWFVNSCEKLYPGYQFFAVRNYRVYKGIIFEADIVDEYLLELNELKKNDQSILFDGRISSESPDGKLRFHYQAEVELRKTIPEQPTIASFNLEPQAPIEGISLYDAKILFHGPSFQGVQEVLNLSATGVTTRCNLTPVSAEAMGQFPAGSFNPFLADVHLQSLLIWANSQLNTIGLPLSIAAGTQYKQIPPGTTSFVTMTVKTQTAHKLVADVISHDQEGNIFAEVVDAEITLNKNLFELFKDNHLEKEPQWH